MRIHWENRYRSERAKMIDAMADGLASNIAFQEQPATVAARAVGISAPAVLPPQQEKLVLVGTAESVKSELERLKPRVAAVPNPPLSPGDVEIHFPALIRDQLLRSAMGSRLASSDRSLREARDLATSALADTVYFLAVQAAVRQSKSTRFVGIPLIAESVFADAFKRVMREALPTGASADELAIKRHLQLFPNEPIEGIVRRRSSWDSKSVAAGIVIGASATAAVLMARSSSTRAA